MSDRSTAFGPFTFRVVGFVLAGLFAVIVFIAVYRRPTLDQLALGLAAISLAAFVALTTMHERYAYPALVFLLLALGRPAVAVAWVVFAITFLLNLLVAVPPEGWTIPEARTLTIVGSVVMTVVAVGVVILLAARGPLRGDRRSRSSGQDRARARGSGVCVHQSAIRRRRRGPAIASSRSASLGSQRDRDVGGQVQQATSQASCW